MNDEYKELKTNCLPSPGLMSGTSLSGYLTVPGAWGTELYKALLAAQPSIEAALKDSKNPHFKSNYADINSVIAACKEQLNKVGIVVIQPVVTDSLGAYVETRLIHAETGQSVESRVPLVGASDMQKLGSAITYARRYGLQALVLLGAEDDDGNAASGKTEAPQSRPYAPQLRSGFEEPKPAPQQSRTPSPFAAKPALPGVKK